MGHHVTYILFISSKTKLFDILLWILQDDTLAKFYFIMAMAPNHVICKAMNEKENISDSRCDVDKAKSIWPVCIIDLDFADNIELINIQGKPGQTLLNIIESAAASISLMANPK